MERHRHAIQEERGTIYPHKVNAPHVGAFFFIQSGGYFYIRIDGFIS
jgi:hypothetical protein